MVASHRFLSPLLATLVVLTASHALQAQQMLKLPRVSIEQALPAASQGDPLACYILGSLYFRGNGKAPDYPTAVRWLTAAADQGVAQAQLALAEMYYDGTKVVQNDQFAFKWYQYAALQGMPWAELGMAMLYEEGRGVSPSPTEASRWYEQAARHGHVTAMHQLGMRYYQGLGVPKDLLRSYVWLTIAAARGMQGAVTARDDLRTHLSRSLIDAGQREAAAFEPTPHHNASQLAAEIEKLRERAGQLALQADSTN